MSIYIFFLFCFDYSFISWNFILYKKFVKILQRYIAHNLFYIEETIYLFFFEFDSSTVIVAPIRGAKKTRGAKYKWLIKYRMMGFRENPIACNPARTLYRAVLICPFNVGTNNNRRVKTKTITAFRSCQLSPNKSRSCSR